LQDQQLSQSGKSKEQQYGPGPNLRPQSKCVKFIDKVTSGLIKDVIY